MDVTQIASAMPTSNTTPVQGMGGHHHHHHKSISDQVSSMESAIDNAVQSGKLTSDQATAMKKELDDVTQTLAQNQTAATSQTSATGQTATTSQTSAISQLSDDDKKKIFGELQDVRKQLHAALAPQGTQGTQGTTSTSSTDQINQLFSSIDTDGNGSISQSEFSAFLNSVAQGGYSTGYNNQGTLTQSAGAAAQSSLSLLA